MSKARLLASLAVILSLYTRWAAAGVVIVVPGDNATTEGGVSNIRPFDFSSNRYQQVYDASAFTSFVGPHMLTQIAFRPDARFGSAFSKTITDIQISFSTTSKAVGGLSPPFASNIGGDDTIVHRGPLTLSSNFTGSVSGPKDFDIVINLTTPFLYDPSRGNLLLDVRNNSGEVFFMVPVYIDAQLAPGITSRAGVLPGHNSSWPTADGFDAIGLVTQFTFADTAAVTSLPVPAAAWSGLIGFLLIAINRRKTLRRAGHPPQR